MGRATGWVTSSSDPPIDGERARCRESTFARFRQFRTLIVDVESQSLVPLDPLCSVRPKVRAGARGHESIGGGPGLIGLSLPSRLVAVLPRRLVTVGRHRMNQHCDGHGVHAPHSCGLPTTPRETAYPSVDVSALIPTAPFAVGVLERADLRLKPYGYITTWNTMNCKVHPRYMQTYQSVYLSI
jgi:hypothetical protein